MLNIGADVMLIEPSGPSRETEGPMFDYRLLNLDGTPAEHPTFRSSQPDWRVGDKVLIRPGTEYRIIGMEAAPPEGVHGIWFVEPVRSGH